MNKWSFTVFFKYEPDVSKCCVYKYMQSSNLQIIYLVGDLKEHSSIFPV